MKNRPEIFFNKSLILIEFFHWFRKYVRAIELPLSYIGRLYNTRNPTGSKVPLYLYLFNHHSIHLRIHRLDGHVTLVMMDTTLEQNSI